MDRGSRVKKIRKTSYESGKLVSRQYGQFSTKRRLATYFYYVIQSVQFVYLLRSIHRTITELAGYIQRPVHPTMNEVSYCQARLVKIIIRFVGLHGVLASEA